jgi:hypothetical protein
VEVNHGPFVVDNNLFLSGVSLLDMSEGGAYAHNLMTGRIVSRPELRRSTPYHPAHSTAVAGLVNIKGGDNRFYNNILVGDGESSGGAGKLAGKDPRRADGFGLYVYDAREFPLQTGGNVYFNGARPYSKEVKPIVETGVDPKASLEEERVYYQPAAPGAPFRTRVVEGGKVDLHLTLGQAIEQADSRLVTTELLGKARIPGLPYENPDGSPLRVDTDYFGKKRNAARPTAGPFETPGAGPLVLKVW